MPETRTPEEALTAEPVVDAVSDPTPEAAPAPADEAPVQGSDALGTMQENAEGDPSNDRGKEGMAVRTPEIVAKAGGILPLVELLKSERVGPHENASRALWQLAYDPDNQIAIAASGGIVPLVTQLTAGSDATQRHSAAAIENLAKDNSENQLALAKAKAIAPLVSLLGSDSMETQAHSVGALLYLASHVECRNAVIRRLVNVLDERNANAQMRAATALAVLASRNITYRNAIAEAGAVPPLVRQLGDGLRVENDTPQERAACVLSDLARSAECKVDIAASGGVEPLVRMLASTSNKGQTAAATTLSHLSMTGENKIAIANFGGIGDSWPCWQMIIPTPNATRPLPSAS